MSKTPKRTTPIISLSRGMNKQLGLGPFVQRTRGKPTETFNSSLETLDQEQARNQNFRFAQDFFIGQTSYEFNYLEDYAIFQKTVAKVKVEDDDVDKERNCCLILKRANFLISRYILKTGIDEMNLRAEDADTKKIVANFNKAKGFFLRLFPESKLELDLELDLNSLLNSVLVSAFSFGSNIKNKTRRKLLEIDRQHKQTLILTGKTCIGKVRKIINSIDEKVFYKVPSDIHHAFNDLKNSAKKKSVNLADERSSSIASTTMEEVVADFANLEANVASLGEKINMVIAGNVDNGSRAEHDDDGKVIIWV
mmetsp:Transcript_27532/g.41903  ORF Transcript_27532/g.41903 Transcript_27532/m.41903 type:complete len:309 (-) Transcript_27532:170-1096(-)|eukprot:CAMPEP_0194239986 /NCGR_PEP_ID=MMETSP0158-20130606/6289_1 /TAXON_ID=33649 /ORGANISM="Thalassionema nitzschioides, Strain L26-B" /LENGTH=308 /DNA_ID=CAMNT_0038974581 /DNA_START=554 /DNA_END=1480 /DNA_ORIENTATION=+